MNTQKQTDESHYGYTNYETWLVMNHINNDKRGEIYNNWYKIAGDLQDAEELKKRLFERYFYELSPSYSDSSFYGALLERSLFHRVNWQEIAEALTEDAKLP